MELKFLIVDDDSDVLEVLVDAVDVWPSEKYTTAVKTASNGQSGLELLQTEKFHVAIVDIKMPVLNGIELIQKLKTSDGPNKEIPIIVQSGFTEAYLETLNSEQFKDVLVMTKPLDIKAIFNSIDWAVSRFH